MSHAEPPASQMNLAAVNARIRSEYSVAEEAMALSELARYKGDSQPEQARIHHAILTLAAGDLNQLRHFVDRALIDFRDVIFWAYNPEEATLTREQAQAFLNRLEKAGMKNVPKLPEGG